MSNMNGFQPKRTSRSEGGGKDPQQLASDKHLVMIASAAIHADGFAVFEPLPSPDEIAAAQKRLVQYMVETGFERCGPRTDGTAFRPLPPQLGGSKGVDGEEDGELAVGGGGSWTGGHP